MLRAEQRWDKKEISEVKKGFRLQRFVFTDDTLLWTCDGLVPAREVRDRYEEAYRMGITYDAVRIGRRIVCPYCKGTGQRSLDCICHGGGEATRECSPCPYCEGLGYFGLTR